MDFSNASSRLTSCFLTTAAAALALSACTGPAPSAPIATSKPVVNSAVTTPAREDETLPALTRESGSPVEVTVVVDKNALLSQDFLYGSDLQHSSIQSGSLDLFNQSLSVGHLVARFRVVGSELQLVASNTDRYASDENHPEQLLSRFKILAQTDTTLTITGADSSAYLTQLTQAVEGVPPGPQAPALQDHWIRSFQYVPEGNYLLQETSIQLTDGNVAEYMESIFPRSTLTPSADFQKFQMDPDDLVGAADGPVARFRFLKTDPTYESGKKVSYAEHFDVSASQGEIQWFVTRNVPDERLPDLKAGVEGWNRYFRDFKGYNRDVMRFMGKLPEGVKLGDPRYNVINWDSITVAGAAYESQAFDPATGKQSHSMVYLPAAWFEIGVNYWKNGIASDSGNATTTRQGSQSSKKLAACERDLRDMAAQLASGATSASSEEELKVFARELVKQVLFHEIGHSLGLAHNFKGSLSYDPTDPKSMFSTSIMDYNDYSLERQAFSSLEGSEGPKLEYDRQALSALYNKGQDIADSDAVLPACADAEADFEDGQVDPLCIRYDLDKDPSDSVKIAYERITQSERAGDVTLAQALAKLPKIYLSDARLASIQTKEDLAKASSQLGAAFFGTIQFYVTGGVGSLAKTADTDIKLLLSFDETALPKGYDAAAMRARAFEGISNTMKLNVLPTVVVDAVKASAQASVDRIAKSPYAASLSADEASKVLSSIRDGLVKSVDAFQSDATRGIPRLHGRILGSLKRRAKVAYFLGGGTDANAAATDYETAVVQLLAQAVAPDSLRPASERIAAAASLVTFAGRLSTDGLFAPMIEKIRKEAQAARDNASRETAEALLKILRSAGA